MADSAFGDMSSSTPPSSTSSEMYYADSYENLLATAIINKVRMSVRMMHL